MRLLKAFINGKRVAKVYKDLEWEEYRVKFFVDDVQQVHADYHTDDKQDALSTAETWSESCSEQK